MNTTCQHGKEMPATLARLLPENQGGPTRHRCAVCAYERGYKDGMKYALNVLKQEVNDLR